MPKRVKPLPILEGPLILFRRWDKLPLQLKGKETPKTNVLKFLLCVQTRLGFRKWTVTGSQEVTT